AQAPNVGPFRLRYLPPGSPVIFSGNCSAIPTVVSLPTNTCYTMAQSDISIYASADANSSVIATMHFGDYTKVIGTKGKIGSNNSDYWIKVDLTDGSLYGSTQGWIKSSDVNFN